VSSRWLASAVIATAMLGMTAAPAQAAAPPNDRYGDAVIIGSLPFQTIVDTTDATVSPGDPDCASSSHTAWYSFTPAVSGAYTFDVNGLWDAFGPSLGVFSGPRTSATQIACDVAIGGEDFGGIAVDRVTLTAGVSYHIMVGTPGGFEGAVEPGGSLFVRAVLYVPPAAKVHILSGTVDRDTRVLTLAGTVDCRGTYAYGALDGFPDVRARARQLRATWLARGSGETYPAAGCFTPARWTMTLQSSTAHPFKRGRATITAQGHECNLWECVTRTTKARLFLQWG
jgi:hypothetical protein